MPYFKWYGINAEGAIGKGVDFARSSEMLVKVVQHKYQLELLSYEHKRQGILAPFSYQQKAQFFKQLGELLQAGVPVVDALGVIELSTSHAYFKDIVSDCAQAVREGNSLSQVCIFYHDLVSPFVWQVLVCGEESGALDKACLEIADYYTSLGAFTQKIKAALLMPGITLGFFVLIVGVLFFAVIPRFGALLLSLHKPLPARTLQLIHISGWLQDHYVVLLGLLGMGFCVVLWSMRHIKDWEWQNVAIYIPLVKDWIIASTWVFFFRNLGSALISGVDIAQALHVACSGISCRYLQRYYQQLLQQVVAGASLSQVLRNSAIKVEGSCIAFIATGESTGKLGVMMHKCADIYQEKLYKSLHSCTQLMQPLILILLGLLVALLIFVLYEPIFTLSTVM